MVVDALQGAQRLPVRFRLQVGFIHDFRLPAAVFEIDSPDRWKLDQASTPPWMKCAGDEGDPASPPYKYVNATASATSTVTAADFLQRAAVLGAARRNSRISWPRFGRRA